MLLDKDEHSFELSAFDILALNQALAKWREWPPSGLVHHGALCCTAAREWLSSTDYSYLHGDSVLAGPRWIRHRFGWGPSRWPLAWCEAVKEKTLDCGAHSALAREVFSSRGLTAHPVQLIQQYSEDITKHWKAKWSQAGVSHEWVLGNLIYHEACAIEPVLGQIKIWDPSAGTWINPNNPGGFGSLLAWRVTNSTVQSEHAVFWDDSQVAWNEWQRAIRKDTNWSSARPPAPEKVTVGSIRQIESVLTLEEPPRSDVVSIG